MLWSIINTFTSGLYLLVAVSDLRHGVLYCEPPLCVGQSRQSSAHHHFTLNAISHHRQTYTVMTWWHDDMITDRLFIFYKWKSVLETHEQQLQLTNESYSENSESLVWFGKKLGLVWRSYLQPLLICPITRTARNTPNTCSPATTEIEIVYVTIASNPKKLS